MRYLPYGRTGLRVSEICLGGVGLGGGAGGIGEAESRAVFHAYLDAGGNFIDTANLYNGGASEEMVGKLVRGLRDDLVIATKFGMGAVGEPILAGGGSRKSLRRSVERSLKRLGTDHIDILHLHQWDFDTGMEELLQAMGDLVTRGLVDNIALSNTPAWIVSRCDAIADLKGWPRFAGMQIPYSLLERTADREVVPMARALSLGLCCWAPLAQGSLAHRDAPRSTATPPHVHHDAIVAALDGIAQARGLSMAQVALAWLRQQPGDMIAVVGADSVVQLRDNLASAELVLDTDDLTLLDELSAVDPGYPQEYLRRDSFRNMRTAFQPEKLRSRHYGDGG